MNPEYCRYDPPHTVNMTPEYCKCDPLNTVNMTPEYCKYDPLNIVNMNQKHCKRPLLEMTQKHIFGPPQQFIRGVVGGVVLEHLVVMADLLHVVQDHAARNVPRHC